MGSEKSGSGLAGEQRGLEMYQTILQQIPSVINAALSSVSIITRFLLHFSLPSLNRSYDLNQFISD